MCGTYRTEDAVEAHVTAVEAGNGRHYLVVRFRIREWKTLVFQHAMAPDSWLSRRELHQNMDPVPALTGILFGPTLLPHPVEALKRELDAMKKSNWELRNKLLQAIPSAKRKVARKRGARVRRNP